MKTSVFVLVCVVVSCYVIGGCQGGPLRKNFYRKTCPNAEKIIQEMTWNETATNFVLPARLLRMHFHDCFVRGCDASILLNSTTGNTAEKDAIPNRSLTGFDFIERVKARLESECPNTVSCADILTLVARDSVSFQFKKPQWEVLTGRRDGTVSKSSEVQGNIPPPTFNFSSLKQNFANKNLTVHDLVVLSGAHTIGVGHCNLFSQRLYNFTGKGDQDPSLDAKYAAFLKTQCKNLTDRTTFVPMDPGSVGTFDASYFKTVMENKGLFTSDAALLTNRGARTITAELTSQDKFMTEFAQSMKRMGAIQVLSGSSGQIRKICGVVNS